MFGVFDVMNNMIVREDVVLKIQGALQSSSCILHMYLYLLGRYLLLHR